MQQNYYFTNENIFSFNSGTEFSAINRQKLFKKNQMKSWIVTRNYNQNLYFTTQQHGLEYDDLINMYDYFQNAVDVKKHHEYLRYSKLIDKHEYKIVGVDNNSSLIKRHGRTLAKVEIAPQTVGEIGNVLYYDQFGNITSKDVWDIRGFKSKTEYMHPDGHIGHEILYDYDGQPVMEITHMFKNNDNPSMFKLLNYKGKNLRFNDENELFAFFLKELIGKDHKAIVINDRPSLIAPVAQLNCKKYQYLHSIQTTDAEMAGNPKGTLFPAFAPFFTNDFQYYDGLIVPTPGQAKDINKLFPNINTQSISDIAVFNTKLVDQKVDNHLLFLGRLSPDHNLEQMIKIVELVKEEIPEIKLNLVGYFDNPDYREKLKKMVKDLALEKNVIFKPYLVGQAKQEQFDNAKLVIDTSFGEAMGMTMVEALSNGIPFVSYDVNYGPRFMINNNYNGFLINQGDIRRFSEIIVNYLKHSDIYEKLSYNAVFSIKKLLEQHIISDWKRI
ncbi:glycosyltransferase [Apilactobacillus timberlakei]|uniref:glycosyltransferase n=1 Tax=Apilactobacillus timberlakei TaxID=2008380 RepID=UPI00112CA199|nr:glycosyltransferase [Apilactobacillus timberlakei]TPR19322.1 glycosyltransferase [Apilactobacillus timberlakei]